MNIPIKAATSCKTNIPIMNLYVKVINHNMKSLWLQTMQELEHNSCAFKNNSDLFSGKEKDTGTCRHFKNPNWLPMLNQSDCQDFKSWYQ